MILAGTGDSVIHPRKRQFPTAFASIWGFAVITAKAAGICMAFHSLHGNLTHVSSTGSSRGEENPQFQWASKPHFTDKKTIQEINETSLPATGQAAQVVRAILWGHQATRKVASPSPSGGQGPAATAKAQTSASADGIPQFQTYYTACVVIYSKTFYYRQCDICVCASIVGERWLDQESTKAAASVDQRA